MRRYVVVLKWLTLSLFSYVAALAVAHVSWDEAIAGLLIPRIEFSTSFLTTIVAILGTTISPYLFLAGLAGVLMPVNGHRSKGVNLCGKRSTPSSRTSTP